MVPLANEPSAVETVAPAESDNSPSLAQPESAASPAELGSEQSPDLQLAMESAVRWSPLPGTESDGAVLLDRETQLTRATAEQNVPVGARIVVPASTRTTLQLDDGMEWLTCGPSILVPEGLLSDEQTNQDEPQGDNRVAISSPLCRGILVSTKAGRSLRMATPFQSLDIDFGGAGSRISLEVTYRPETHGSILDRDAFKPILVIVVLEGDVQITSKTDGKSMAVALGQGFASVSGQEPRLFKIESIPPWLRSETERPVDVVAARDLSMMLAAAPDANLRNQLAALTQHRRPETAAAAIQLELLLSNFNPFVDSLSNARMRAHWQRTIEIARQALASDPQLSQACEVAFRNKYGEGPGVQLFKLLCGPTGGEIDDGVIAKLISELESPRLEYRVLAAYQLHELTGQTLGFQPHAPERLSVQAWRRENAAEKLPLLDLIDLIWERVP